MKTKVHRFRVVRYGDKFLVQQWYDRVLFYRPGWYTYWSSWDGQGWTANTGHYTVEKFATINKAEEFIGRIIDRNLPDPDVEPVEHLDPHGEELRKAAAEGGEDEELIYADWCEEHGFLNNAARIRISQATMKIAKQETERAGT